MSIPLDTTPGTDVFVVVNYRVGTYKLLCVTPLYCGYWTSSEGNMTYSSQNDCFLDLEAAWMAAGRGAMTTAAYASAKASEAFAEAEKIGGRNE